MLKTKKTQKLSLFPSGWQRGDMAGLAAVLARLGWVAPGQGTRQAPHGYQAGAEEEPSLY